MLANPKGLHSTAEFVHPKFTELSAKMLTLLPFCCFLFIYFFLEKLRNEQMHLKKLIFQEFMVTVKV